MQLIEAPLSQMLKSEREARRKRRVEALRDAVLVLMRGARNKSVAPYLGEFKYFRRHVENDFIANLLTPRPASKRAHLELSKLSIRSGSRKVLDIKWNEATFFKVIVFRPGDWERTLHVVRDKIL